MPAKGRAPAKKRKPAAASRTKKPAAQEVTKRKLSNQSKAILLSAFAALLFFFFVYKGESVWLMIHDFLWGIFGGCGIVLPFFLIYIAIMTALEKKMTTKATGKMILSLVVFILLSVVIYLFSIHSTPQSSYFNALSNLYVSGSNFGATGAFSGVLGYPLAKLFGLTGAKIFSIIALTTSVMFLFGVTIKGILRMSKKSADRIKENVAVVRENLEQRANKPDRDELYNKKQNDENAAMKSAMKAEKRARKEAEKEAARESKRKLDKKPKMSNAKHGQLIDIPFDVVDEEPKEQQSKDEALKDAMNKLNVDLKADKPQKPAASMAADFIVKDKKRKAEPEKKKEVIKSDDIKAEDVKAVAKKDGYQLPPAELLYPHESVADDQKVRKELSETGERLVETLNSFGVDVTITEIARGPSVTRYELQPARGVKISKITNLSDDIALNLAAERVRIEAPIPGKAAVGIEIPNKTVSTVSMRDLIDSSKFKTASSKLSVVLGKDISGNTVITDLGAMPHLLVAGTTGSGKSVCVNSILVSLLYKATPDEVKLMLIDPKMVEFTKYKDIPHLLVPVVTDPKKAAGTLNWAVSEMNERYKAFSLYGVKSIGSYNKMVEKYHKEYGDKVFLEDKEERPMTDNGLPIPEKIMEYIVIAIDELADLMMTAPNEVEESICLLAQKARAAGMHLVIATQRPSVNVITGVIKANIPSRIALKTSSQIDSRTILDSSGAEKLLGRGDMLFLKVGQTNPTRVQGCYASDEEIENVTSYIKKAHSSVYNEKVVEEIEKITETDIATGKKESSDDSSESSADPMLEEAIKCVSEAGQASTSLLQRRLRLGYARAGRLVDEMEQMGIVGPHEGSKPRQVLMSYAQWLERKNIISE